MEENNFNIKKVFIGIIIGTLVIGGIIYAGSVISKKNGGKLTLPTGPAYTGEEAQETPPTAPLRFTTSADTKWSTISSKYYSFSAPENLGLGKFTDPPESFGIIWGNIDPRNNILADLQSINDRAPQYLGNPEEYVKNWWKFFPGLKGLLSINKITTTNGLSGYRAIYVNTSGQAPNIDVFLSIPNNRMIHLANGILDPTIFDKIVDSVKYVGPSAPTATPTQ